MISVADLFCGAGGSSTGLVRAAEKLSMKIDLLAVNHWPVAVETHTRNHPWARHLCADLSQVDPNKAVPSGRLDLLIASPECTHHSIARGGKPCSDQSRASAWHVLHWAERLSVREILIENVREFLGWGPLLDNSRPDPKRKGETFEAFANALRSLGYVVEWRVLNAADFGDATCRKRLFIRASRTGAIHWPRPTHVGRWRPAREVIDWDLPGQSIFNRKRPLAKRTLDRIEAGLRKFGGEPFIAVLRGTQPDQAGSWATTAKGGAFGLCEPFLTKYYGASRSAKPVTEPMDTITTKDRFALVIPSGMDIRFRMLQPRELAAAMGFDDYSFAGNKTEQVRQIGNAVAVRTAQALCDQILRSNTEKERT